MRKGNTEAEKRKYWTSTRLVKELSHHIVYVCVCVCSRKGGRSTEGRGNSCSMKEWLGWVLTDRASWRHNNGGVKTTKNEQKTDTNRKDGQRRKWKELRTKEIKIQNEQWQCVFLGTSFQHCVGRWKHIPQHRWRGEEKCNVFYFSTSIWTKTFKK